MYVLPRTIKLRAYVDFIALDYLRLPDGNALFKVQAELSHSQVILRVDATLAVKEVEEYAQAAQQSKVDA